MHVTIKKYSGEEVIFSEDKLKSSLQKAGANQHTIDLVSKQITDHLFPGISTKQIYQKAHKLLKKISSKNASRYKLKQAILELGPTGYPFEWLIGDLFKKQGYDTEVGVVTPGHCVNHEVDVIADNGKERHMVECKFHNRLGYKSDVKIPLYIQSRFLDVKSEWTKIPAHSEKKMTGWVVTNARFTTDALDYGKCVGLKLLAWDYPINEGLKSLVELHHIQPITTLSSLTKLDREKLLKEGIVLCSDLCDRQNEAHLILGKKANKLLEEAEYVCSV
ncbi:MAG: hypothetical protein ACI8QD_002197 [Cyclobacteriaceae bacterium]|jgi:hypothetical protein